MKKKRFIKLLMGAYRVSRNTASEYAEIIQRRGGSYLKSLTEMEKVVRQISAEYGIPRSVLCAPEKGLEKQLRKQQKAMRGGADNA